MNEETKIEDVPDHVKSIKGFELAWGEYLKWVKEQRNKKCPKCGDQLYKVRDNPEYWMCYRCIKGYTKKELTKEC